jgi:disulfide bond formation protein DsbB
MLQRVAFCAVTFGFLLNLRFGARASHHGIVLLGALFGMAVSGRQVLLHVAPGSGAHGSAFLGLHFHSWAFVLFAATVLATAGLLLVHPKDESDADAPAAPLSRLAIGCAIALTLANAATTFAQCGPIECDDNPVRYWLADRLG